MSHATRPGLPVAGLPGTVAGYRLDRCVGQGSRAVVYLAQDERVQRRVALKVMTPELARDTGFRATMISESRAAAALGHPHIVPVFQADETDGTLYAAMRYVTGGDGRSLLSRHGPLPLGKAWRVIAQIASALDAAHAHGLIHRDVRPANILLDSDDAGDRGTGGHAYLSDFGMSQAFPSGQVITPDRAAGILDYLAPEQIEGRDIDGRADQYSLACTGFELLCGTPPFGPDQGQTLMYAQIYADPPAASARRAGIPAAVDSVLATALAKDPADRYPSCGRLAAELRAALGLRSGESADPSRSPAPRGFGPRTMLRAAPAASRPASDAGQPGRAGSQAAPAANEPHAEVTDPPTEPGPQAPGPQAPAPAPAGDPGGPDPEPPARRTWALGPVLAAGTVVVVAAAVVSGVALSGR
ncbi:MAG: serine/threonine-protein kinase [Streptosporangiaceae bacterium]